MARSSLVIVGAGPVGLELAIRACSEHEVTVIEKAPTIAGNIHEWGHVKLFSPWSMNMSDQGRKMLQERNVEVPQDDVFPSGHEFVAGYLDHLHAHLGEQEGCRVLLSTQVISAAREGKMKGDMSGRDGKFRLMVETPDGEEEHIHCDQLVDASGTWGNPNWIGDGGAPAIGERKYAREIVRGLPASFPDGRFVGKRVMVVGSGASAITFVNQLRESALASTGPPTKLLWVTRRGGQGDDAEGEPLYKRIEGDPLPQRDSLSVIANRLIEGKGEGPQFEVEHHGKASLKKVSKASPVWTVSTCGGAQLECDEIVSCTGYRPDSLLFEELQVHQCYATEGPMKLAAALMAAGGSGGGDCLAQVAPGPQTLTTPEKGFYILGMKSYGRGSAFLLKIGNDQCDMAIELIRDHQQSSA